MFSSISSSLNNEPLETLTAIAHFLCSNQRSVITLPASNDQSMIILYQVAKEESDALNLYNRTKLSALTTIEKAHQKASRKIERNDKGILYLQTTKAYVISNENHIILD